MCQRLVIQTIPQTLGNKKNSLPNGTLLCPSRSGCYFGCVNQRRTWHEHLCPFVVINFWLKVFLTNSSRPLGLSIFPRRRGEATVFGVCASSYSHRQLAVEVPKINFFIKNPSSTLWFLSHHHHPSPGSCDGRVFVHRVEQLLCSSSLSLSFWMVMTFLTPRLVSFQTLFFLLGYFFHPLVHHLLS